MTVPKQTLYFLQKKIFSLFKSSDKQPFSCISEYLVTSIYSKSFFLKLLYTLELVLYFLFTKEVFYLIKINSQYEYKNVWNSSILNLKF